MRLRRLLINAAIFQLDYKDQLTSENGVLYYSSVLGAGVKAANVSLYGNLNARVRGAEVSIAAKPFTGFNLGANLSYSKITSQGGTYACSDGVAPTALNPIHSCVSAKGQAPT